MSTPTVIAVGGLDDGAGAGLTRDAHTAASLGASCLLVGTAWTRQRASLTNRGFDARSPEEIALHLRSLLESAPSGNLAVKVGMVALSSTVETITRCLSEPQSSLLPLVFDPVLGSTSGISLFRGDGKVLQGLLPLIRRATLLTPNRGELALLTGMPVDNFEDADRAAGRLLELGARAVLVKGGHWNGPAVDRLWTAGGVTAFSRPRIVGRDPRGTGCALATAIAIGLASGTPLPDACREAGDWLARQIGNAVERAGAWHLP